MKSDNLAPVPRERQPLAHAALKLLDSLEAGTAVDWVAERGECIKVGDVVKYKSLSGGIYDAVLTGIGLHDVDIDVAVPGAEPVRLTRIKLVESK